mmetsp:Transcript_36525/g.96208  ORF Transcript_36525/g.96208 Transcript_36525/m.96208 type:complete len:90 (+) Transcript_36525:960-1229(+)
MSSRSKYLFPRLSVPVLALLVPDGELTRISTSWLWSFGFCDMCTARRPFRVVNNKLRKHELEYKAKLRTRHLAGSPAQSPPQPAVLSVP